MQQNMGAGGFIQLKIPDRATLQASYLSFVKGGGLFIPSTLDVELGNEVFVLATLPDHAEKIPLKGKVVWISQKHTGLKPQGFAIQLTGDKGLFYKNEAEKLLAGTLSLDRPSYTM